MKMVAFKDVRNYIGTLNSFFLILIAVTLPYKNNINSLVIIMFCVTSVVLIDKKQFQSSLRKSPFWLFSVLYFSAIALSLTWETQSVNFFKSLESYLSYLVLVPIIAMNPTIDSRLIKRINIAFVISVVIGCSICFVKSAIEYQETGDYRIFYYQYLSSQIMINAIYLSLYCSYCFFCLFYYWKNFAAFNIGARLGVLLVGLFLTVTIVLLSSKMIIGIHILLCFFFLLRFFWRKGKFLVGVLIMFVAGTLVFAAVWQMPYVKWRIEQTFVKSYEGQQDNQNGLAVRFKIWQMSAELIKDKPVTGYGAKSGYTRLVDKYRQNDFQVALESGYNAHNNFLQTMLNYGLPGLFTLLLMLFSASAKAYKRSDVILAILLILIVALCVTECMLEVQKGIIFFTVFVPLLIYHQTDIRNPAV